MFRKALFLLLLCCAAPGHATASDAAMAVDWNKTVLRVAEAEDGFLTLKGLRTVTMMHLAMNDALASGHRRYGAYAYHQPLDVSEAAAAANHAALAIAVSQYPDDAETFEALHNHWLGQAAVNDSNDARQVGEEAVKALLALRKDDGWHGEAQYEWHPMAPGVYAEFNEHSGTPQGFIFGSGWARAKGFALAMPNEFRSPPPPAIDSEAYTIAFNEVKAVGRFQSMERTPDQTHLALWWKDFAENSHNRLARDLVSKEQLPLVEANRLFALLNMSIYDGYIASFNNKFFYNHWRPFTAIRWAANDGNADTEAEETWTNTHRHTYAFPSYPSAHGTACAAAMMAFEDVFGEDYAFTMRIPMVDIAGPFSGKIEMWPPTRSFDNFREAADECGASRVYLGIHFRYDSVEGVKLGRQVGKNVVDLLLDRSD